jgi:dsRNA-specific ribonuclease
MAKKPAKKTGAGRLRSWAGSRTGKIVLGLIVLIIALHLALPHILLRYANRALADMKGYYGHVEDIDVALWRGAYVLDSIYINKVDDTSGKQTEFFASRAVDLSIEWKALFKGHIDGEIIFEQPQLRFTKDRVELDDVSKDTTSFRKLLDELMPIKVNRTQIRDGRVRYIDNTSNPKVDVSLTNLEAVATNLRNAYNSNELLPATLDATANVYGGNMRLAMKMNPLADRSTFDLNAEIEKTDLTKVNDFFQAYAGVDVSKGTFGMYVEAAAKNGKFKGYVKPIIKDLDVAEWEGQDRDDSFLQKLWESVVGGVAELFENQKKDQVATRINYSGSFDDPEVNVGQAILAVLQNAFVQALMPRIEGKINIANIGKQEEKGFLDNLFKGDKKEEKGDGKKEKGEEKKDRKQAEKDVGDKKEKG